MDQRIKNLRRLTEVREEIRDVNTRLDDVIREIEERKIRRNELEDDLAEWKRHEAWLAKKVGEVVQTTNLTNEGEEADQGQSIEDVADVVIRNKDATIVVEAKHGDVAQEVLREHGRPAKIGELIGPILDKNHKLPDPHYIRYNTIYTAMKRRPKDFLPLRGGYWGLVGRDEKYLDGPRPGEPEGQRNILSEYDESEQERGNTKKSSI
jgi:hypothetical protein